MPGRTAYDVSREQVMAAWEMADTAIEAARILDMPVAILRARVSTYRSDGYNLKKMKRGPVKKSKKGPPKQALDEASLLRELNRVASRLTEVRQVEEKEIVLPTPRRREIVHGLLRGKKGGNRGG